VKPILYDKCNLHAFDRETGEFFIISPALVEVRFIIYKGMRIADYTLIKPDRNLIIAQAINVKKAAAKFITLIDIYKNLQHDKR